MPHPPSYRWPQYPEIPIFLDTHQENSDAARYGHISPASSSQRFQQHPRTLQYLAVASMQFTNVSPVSPGPTITNFPPTKPYPKLPQPSVQPAKVWASSERRPPATRPQQKQLPKIPQHGLGILGGHHEQRSIPSIHVSPDHESTDEKKAHTHNEKLEASPNNFAQRIEQKLWRYSSSGNVLKRWLLEIVSWLLSAICMGTIVGVLLVCKDKRLPQWPLGLTLNAFIAILSKIASASLLLPTAEALGQLKWSWFQGDYSRKMWDFEIFDNASRGPWGSLLLLIRTKGKALAAIGAIIVLFSLALDPFFQQVVDFPDRWTLQGNSSIPRVVHYAPVFGKEFKAGEEMAQKDQDVDAVSMKFFFDNGTQPMEFGNGTRPDIPLSCPTSNCTWPPYETLAVCSECTDVSNMLEYSCLFTKVDWAANFTGIGDNYINATVCGFFMNATSSNPVLISGYMADSAGNPNGSILLGRTLPLVTNPKRKQLFGGSINYKHVRNPIVDAIVASAPEGIQSVIDKRLPVAHECVMSWCVKTIESSYLWGTYQEKVTRIYRNETEGSFPWKTERFVSPTLNGTLTTYDSDISIDAPSSGLNGSGYGLSNFTQVNTITVFDAVFPSYQTADNASAEVFMRFKTGRPDSVSLRSLQYNPWTKPYTIVNHLERLAVAITNTIRSGSSKQMIIGSAYDKENFVSVRWIWLSLPLGLLALSFVFLAATILNTAREQGQVGVWKTSAIAMLLYGLPDDVQRKITVASAGTPRAKAKELKVKLLPTKGWRISGNLISPLTPKPHPNQPPPGWI